MTSQATAPAAASRRTERLLLPAVFITQLGNNVQLIGASFLVFHATGTALSVGWLFIAVSIPQAGLAWLFGRLADRYDRRLLCVLSDIGSALAALVLPVWMIMGHEATGAAYTTAFCLAAGAALFLPASSALVKERIAPERIGKFNANFEVASQAGMLLSGAVGGVLFELLGGEPLFFFNSLTFIASAVLIFRIGRLGRAPEPVAVQDEDGSAAAAEPTLPGPRPVKRLVALFAVSSAVITVVNSLMLVLIVERFDQGPAMLGVADALGGIGILLGAAHYGRVAHHDYRLLILCGFGGCALVELVMPLSLFVLLPMIVVAGYAFCIGRIAIRSALMHAAGDDDVGRIFGAAYGFGLAFAVAATVAITTLTDHTSPVAGFVALALLCGLPTLAVVASLYRERDPEGVRDASPALGVTS